MNATRKLNRLIGDTEELLAEIADQRGPEIKALRDRLCESLERTKSALSNQSNDKNDEPEQKHIKVRHVAASLNDYVNEFPWMALATGVLLASTVGILATSATKRSYSR